MAVISNFKAQFDKTSGVFFAGQTLTGTAKFDVTQSVKLAGVSVKYIGKAEVYWKETVQDGTEKKTEHYRNNETYFVKRFRIFNAPNNILRPKSYSIPFKFSLAKELPSSFAGKHGKVNYFLKVIFVRPDNSEEMAKEALPFSVVGLKNLNLLPLLQQPKEASTEKTFGVLAWKSKPLTAMLSINKQAFVPGENIIIRGIIDNQSDVKITHCNLSLLKTVTYRAGKQTQTVSTVLQQLQPGIAKQTKAVWENVKVKVPCLPPSGLDGCSIIDVSYTLEVKIVPSGAHFSLPLSFKITIGTIPFKKVNGPALTSGGDKNKKSVVTTRKSQKCASTQTSFEEPGPASNSSSGIIIPTPEPLGILAPNAKMMTPSSEKGSSMTPPYPIENQSVIPQYQLQANYNNDGVLAYPTAPPSEFSDLGIDLDDGMYQSDLQPTFGEYCWGGDEAPPSYESLFKGGEGEDDDDISRNYVPKYPSYNIQPSAPPKDDDRE